jgi:hypothetical protein
MPVSEKRQQFVLQRFSELCQASIEEQVEFFLKSFIFALGNNWKDVLALSDKFRKYVRDGGEGRMDLNPVQAADFLQKFGLTRTASQRAAELKDVDLNADNRISFIEYLLLHFKSMILREYYERTKESEEEDLSDGAIGLLGVGMKLLDQLFTQPVGLDPGTNNVYCFHYNNCSCGQRLKRPSRSLHEPKRIVNPRFLNCKRNQMKVHYL